MVRSCTMDPNQAILCHLEGHQSMSSRIMETEVGDGDGLTCTYNICIPCMYVYICTGINLVISCCL